MLKIIDAGTPGLARIAPEFASPYLELVRLLREAVQIEHALMVQYLYAAFSVTPVYFNELAGDATGEPGDTLIEVAIQEMKHLSIVSSLAVKLGTRPNLTPHDFPLELAIYPFPFDLAPLGRVSLAKYCYAEAPEGAIDLDNPQDDLSRLVRQELGALRPNHVGSLYRSILSQLDTLATTANPPISLQEIAMYRTQIELVLHEGEGNHYPFFARVLLATHPAFPNDTVWTLPPADSAYPALQTPSNPSALPGHPHVMTGRALDLGALGNLHYWITLFLLVLYFRFNKTDGLSRSKAHMKRVLFPLGRELASIGGGMPFDESSLGADPALDLSHCARMILDLCQEADNLLARIQPPLTTDFSTPEIQKTRAAVTPFI
jgi:hypothetical protein